MQRMTKRTDVETLETKLNQDKHLKVVAKTPRSHLSPEKGAQPQTTFAVLKSSAFSELKALTEELDTLEIRTEAKHFWQWQ